MRSFEKSQSALFFGREQEIEDLYSLVSTEKTVVFFGKSGLGKSSLLEAGLSPLLETNGFRPIRIRFSPPNKLPSGDAGMVNLPLCDFMDAFHALDFRQGIIYDQENPQLWEYIKAAPFIDAAGNPAVPVFIFDQFEEFFYHPKEHQAAFLKQLSEALHDQPPRRILQWITGIEAGSRTAEQMRWHKQPDIRVVFALRSDKLSMMQAFTPYMPGVMRNRYELKPLNRKQAEAAIELPAQKDLGEGYTPPFSFKQPLLQQIVGELGKGSDEIESSQLQMVCNYIENQAKENAAAGTPVTEVTESIINPAADIQKIRDNFYEDQLLKHIPGSAQRSLAKRVLEDDLVVDGQRASLLATQLLAKFDGKKELTDALLKARLIREENTQRGVTYEVSHDTLVAPIEKSKVRRQMAEAQVRQAEELRLAEAERKRLLQEAEDRRKQYEDQKRLWMEAEEARNRARLYGKIAGLFAILALAGGIYFFIDRQNEATNRRKADKVGQELYNKTRELDSVSSLVNTYMLLDLEDATNGRDYTRKDTIAWDILQRTLYVDTLYNQGANSQQINQAIEKLYRITRHSHEGTDGPLPQPVDTAYEKQTEYLQKSFPNVKIREQVQEPVENNEKQWKTRKQNILNRIDSSKNIKYKN